MTQQKSDIETFAQAYDIVREKVFKFTEELGGLDRITSPSKMIRQYFVKEVTPLRNYTIKVSGEEAPTLRIMRHKSEYENPTFKYLLETIGEVKGHDDQVVEIKAALDDFIKAAQTFSTTINTPEEEFLVVYNHALEEVTGIPDDAGGHAIKAKALFKESTHQLKEWAESGQLNEHRRELSNLSVTKLSNEIYWVGPKATKNALAAVDALRSTANALVGLLEHN